MWYGVVDEKQEKNSLGLGPIISGQKVTRIFEYYTLNKKVQ